MTAPRPVDSAVPLPPEVGAGPMPAGPDDSSSAPAVDAGHFSRSDQGYFALAWRRFRRSVVGMIGLVLVCLLVVTSLFADFFAPMDPKEQTLSFAPPDNIVFAAPDGSFSIVPRIYPIVETGELDPITFQPLTKPDLEHPTDLGFFVRGYSYKLLWLIPTDIHFFGSTAGVPVHFLGTDKFGRDILSRGIVGSRISLTIA